MNGGEFSQYLNPFGCALCRYQRKRCYENCEYREYFPMSKFTDLKNARKIFRLINIVRMLRAVDEPQQRSAVAESILKEGKLWEKYPANGPFGVVKSLQAEIEQYEEELEMANKLIQICKEGNFVQFSETINGYDLPIIIPSLGFDDGDVVKREDNGETSGVQAPLDDQNPNFI